MNKIKISSAIEEVFNIRCPISIQRPSSTIASVIYDYENECQYDEQPLSSTVFCGKCARKNSDSLFSSVNSPMSYNQVIC